MEAVTFADDEGTPPPGGTVPPEQKYRLFLDPQSFNEQERGAPSTASGQEDNLPHPDDLPHPDELHEESAPERAHTGTERQEKDEEAGLPPLPTPRPEAPEAGAQRGEIPRVRDMVPGQPARLLSEGRVLALLTVAAVAILAGAGVWGYWLATSESGRPAYSVQVGQPHQLVLEENLEGHYVTNVPSGKRLFVVQGDVENRFPAGEALRWIRIRGTAYASPEQTTPLARAEAYAGNVLDDTQLAHWELPAIKAYYGYTNGRQELNYDVPSGASVPYQLVFADVSDAVGRTVAEVVAYHRAGQAVFIDQP